MWSAIRAVGSALLRPVPQSCVGAEGFNAKISSLCHTLCQTQTPSSLLVPKPVIFIQTAGFKVKGILKLRCKGCTMYKRDSRLFIKCMNFPKHNQMSMVPKHYNRWTLTHATQGKLRPY